MKISTGLTNFVAFAAASPIIQNAKDASTHLTSTSSSIVPRSMNDCTGHKCPSIDAATSTKERRQDDYDEPPTYPYPDYEPTPYDPPQYLPPPQPHYKPFPSYTSTHTEYKPLPTYSPTHHEYKPLPTYTPTHHEYKPLPTYTPNHHEYKPLPSYTTSHQEYKPAPEYHPTSHHPHTYTSTPPEYKPTPYDHSKPLPTDTGYKSHHKPTPHPHPDYKPEYSPHKPKKPVSPPTCNFVPTECINCNKYPEKCQTCNFLFKCGDKKQCSYHGFRDIFTLCEEHGEECPWPGSDDDDEEYGHRKPYGKHGEYHKGSDEVKEKVVDTKSA